ncbi:MAG TPA: YtxH domain-containing protein [Bryobacteraceae bacterium]|nr:YtxH domain-containing protein [Bryobacteraceae bacterium]
MDDTKGLSYFLLGLGVGVAVGIVFAPTSGEETRGRIRTKANEGGDFLRRRTEDLRESAVDLVDRGRTAVGRQREQLNAAVEAGRQAYRETIAEATGSTSNIASNPEGV